MTRQELAEKFIQAGYGTISIDPEDLSIIGIEKIPKSFTSLKYGRKKLSNWEDFCAFVYERVTGKPFPGSRLRGRGFRSQDCARRVAEAIKTTERSTKSLEEENDRTERSTTQTPPAAPQCSPQATRTQLVTSRRAL